MGILGLTFAVFGLYCFIGQQSTIGYFHDGQSLVAFDLAHQSEPFYIKHTKSGKYIHSEGSLLKPVNGEKINIHEGKRPAQEFTYVPIAAYPGFGFIRHTGSGYFLHSKEGRREPYNNTGIVLHRGNGLQTLWKISPNGTISHSGGTFWHPVNPVKGKMGKKN